MPVLLAITAAIVTNGVLAGLFFAFSCAIAPAFRTVDDTTYVTSFRAINRAILNGWFLLVFLAAPALAVVSVALHVWERPEVSVWLLLVGACCSLATFAITVAANVPLNQGLDRASVISEQDASRARQRFERRWNRWNLVRTGTSIGALALFSVSAIL